MLSLTETKFAARLLQQYEPNCKISIDGSVIILWPEDTQGVALGIGLDIELIQTLIGCNILIDTTSDSVYQKHLVRSLKIIESLNIPIITYSTPLHKIYTEAFKRKII